MKTETHAIRINEANIRGVAVLVMTISLLAAVTGNLIFLFILTLDFLIRSLFNPQFSYLRFFSVKTLTPLFRFKKKMIRSKPKRFAAFIGLIITASALILNLYGLSLPSLYLMALLASFSFMEAFFRFCAGCKIFGLLIKLNLIEEEACPDCVYLQETPDTGS